MLKLFIAKLSVYANCVPRSQSFYCRIKMSLLFNARTVSSGCCSFHRQCGCCAQPGGACGSAAGGEQPGWGDGGSCHRDLSERRPRACVSACFCLPARGLRSPQGPWEAWCSLCSAVPAALSMLPMPAGCPAATLPAGHRLSRSRRCAQVSTPSAGDGILWDSPL